MWKKQLKLLGVVCLFIAMCFSLTIYASENNSQPITEVSQINEDGCRLGILTGSTFDAIAKERFPNAQIEYYNTFSDMAIALTQGKLDTFWMDEPMARYMRNEFPYITYLEEFIDKEDYSFAFAKSSEGEALRDQMDAFIEKIEHDGTLDAIDEKWFGTDESVKTIDFDSLTGENGILDFATNSSSPPFVYIKDNTFAGYDIEIAVLFCKEYGYDIVIHDMDFTAIIPGITSGKYDFAAGCITITEERSESVSFAIPNYEGGIAVVVVDSELAESELSFIESISQSFEKTFIREDRWKLIVQGIGTTVFISIYAGIIGTILGFAICMLRRSKNPILSMIAKVYITILQGTPTVVLLLILFFVVFATSSLDAVWIAIIGFALNLAAYVSEMIRTGIDAVDNGQIEASMAIGFNKYETFFFIVLPQAAKHFLPVYKGEFISLVKTTSIVGYVAIQDLTKMSDIIRSSTYEAFFPLISTAIIYFILAYVLTLVLNAIELKIDPKKGERKLKGVKTE